MLDVDLCAQKGGSWVVSSLDNSFSPFCDFEKIIRDNL